MVGKTLWALILFLSMPLASAAVAGENLKQGACISDLSEVIRSPMSHAGKTFEGWARLYVGEGFYEFCPDHPEPTCNIEALPADPLAGSGDLHPLYQARTGDRLFIRGVINPEAVCFSKEGSCVPWHKPIFIDNIRVLAANKSARGCQ
jgi:hypothetical protein